MVNWAMEIKVRAERRAGELLKVMPKNAGTAGAGKPAKLGGSKKEPPKDPAPTLAQHGIGKKDSMRWQQLAGIPEPEFESRIEERKASSSQELPHGEFMTMVERELPFSIRTAGRYMAIASASHLQNGPIVSILPASWGTLYELQRLDQPTFDAAVQAGKIHPEMTRAAAS